MDAEKQAFEDIYTVSLDALMKEMALTPILLKQSPEKIVISVPRINRPGLQLSGFFDYYEAERIQIFGKTELNYLGRMSFEERHLCMDRFLATKPKAVVVTSGLSFTEDDNFSCGYGT